MVFDQSLALSLQQIAQPPAIIEMVQAVDWRAKTFATMLPQWADAIEADVDGRMAQVHRGVTAIWNDREGFPPANVEVMVEHLEALVLKVAKNLSATLDRMEKQFDKAVKRDPGLAKSRPFHKRIIAAGRREVEEKIDAALVFRALRAERAKDARGGPVFDNPDDLQRYLRRELA